MILQTAICLILVTVCQSMSKNQDLDDMAMGILGEPPDSRDERWVDPNSMGDLLGTGSRRRPKLNDGTNNGGSADSTSEAARVLEVLGNLVEGQKTILQAIQTANQTVDPKAGKCRSKAATCELNDVFVKRFVGRLVRRLGWEEKEGGQLPVQGAHLHLELSLTSHQISTLLQFSKGQKVNIHDIDMILDIMIKGHSHVNPTPPIFSKTALREALEESKDLLLSVCATLLLAYLAIFAFRYFSVFKLGLMSVLISITWHWVHMYKNAWAGKHAKLMKTLPPDCRPEHMSWWQSVKSNLGSFYSNADKCEEYHKALMVDPVYEVNPLMAAMNLASNLVFSPLAIFGESFGQTFANLLDALPGAWKVPILIVFTSLLVLSLIMVAGYRIKLPYFLGEFGPAPAAGLESSASELTALRLQLTEVRQLLLLTGPQQLYLREEQQLCPAVGGGLVQRQLGVLCRQQSSGVEELAMMRQETKQPKARTAAAGASESDEESGRPQNIGPTEQETISQTVEENTAAESSHQPRNGDMTSPVLLAHGASCQELETALKTALKALDKTDTSLTDPDPLLAAGE